MATFKRRKLFVDPKVQGAFLARIVLYWFLCVAAAGTAMFSWMFFTGGPSAMYRPLAEFWTHFEPAVYISLLMLPVILFDCTRLTNRLAGPMFRIRREMHKLSLGEPTQPVHLRNGDYWTEFADEFNLVRQRVIGLEEKLKGDPNEPSSARSDQAILDELRALRADVQRQTSREQDEQQEIPEYHSKAMV